MNEPSVRSELFRKCEPFTTVEKLKLVHHLSLDLEKTDTKLHNRHECECCGIILHISNQIGPECAKHPDKIPRNTHRASSQKVTNNTLKNFWSPILTYLSISCGNIH